MIRVFIFLIFISTSGFSQVVDTIYFDKSGDVINPKPNSAYRTVEWLETEVEIKDFDRKGQLIYLGITDKNENQTYDAYNLTSIAKLNVITFYDSKGRKTEMEDCNAEQYFHLFPNLVYDSIPSDLTYHCGYYKNGEIKFHGFFVDDCSWHFRSIFYDRKGRVSWKDNCTYGVLNGVAERFLKGQLLYKLTFVGDIRQGKFTCYKPGGKTVILEGFYKDNKKHGEVKKYNRTDGRLKKIILYDNGKRIKVTKFK